MNERRKLRRAVRRATLSSVAAAPSFQASPKKRSRRFPLRRSLVVTAVLSIGLALLVAVPKAAHAAGDIPEIDPTSMAGALTLLVGGVLTLTDRIRRA